MIYYISPEFREKYALVDNYVRKQGFPVIIRCKRRHCVMLFVKNNSRKEAAPPFPYILKFVAKGATALCLLRLNLPLTRLMGVSTYVMPTAPVGLRRMCELRNCHFRGDFVTEAAHHLGAAETTECRANANIGFS